MADILTQLSNKCGCDKSDKNHRYTQIYHRYFEKDRRREFNFMELGFGKGASVKMWMEYFTKANIINIDIREKLPNDKLIQRYARDKRFEFVSTDQINMKKILKIVNKYKKFYLIIDDATFGCLFEFIEPGGYYIIEDLKCKRSHSNKFKCQSDKTLKVLLGFLKNRIFDSKVLDKQQKLYIRKNIESVKIYDKIVFIKKKG